jgi:hypothetical protein
MVYQRGDWEMKSVVVEIKNNFAAVLSDDGTITKVKNKRYVVGQTIELAGNNTNHIMKYASLAASIAILIFGISGFTIYKLPYSYVSVDVNPSITFTLNRFDRVLAVKAINDDGYDILQELPLNELKNKTVKIALSKTISQIADSGYFDMQDKDGILIATSGKNATKSQELADTLKESIDTELEQIDPNVDIESIAVSQERLQQAEELGITPGKLNLIESLKDISNDPEFSIEEWSQKSVKEIMNARNNKNSVSNEDEDINDTTHSDSNETDSNQNKESQLDENKDKDKKEKSDKDNTSKSNSIKSNSNSENGTNNSNNNSESNKEKPTTNLNQNNSKNSDSDNSNGNTQKSNSTNEKMNTNQGNTNKNNNSNNNSTPNKTSTESKNSNIKSKTNSDKETSESNSKKNNNTDTKKKITNAESNHIIDTEEKPVSNTNNTKDKSDNNTNTDKNTDADVTTDESLESESESNDDESNNNSKGKN